MGRFIWNVRFNRDNYFSFFGNNIYFVENRYQAGMSFYLTRTLRWDGSIVFGRNKYPELQQISLPDGGYEEISREDDFRTLTTGLVVRVLRSTGIGLSVNFWRHKSNYFNWGTRSNMVISGYVTYDF